MRAFAITGMDTVLTMPSMRSGSLIRATPPWARMSAGTRSSAMTATAPASSAILACSAVTTSMITPPLSISAMPRFTRAVPTAGTSVPVAGWVVSVVTEVLAVRVRGVSGSHRSRARRVPGRASTRRAGRSRSPSGRGRRLPGPAERGGPRVVQLERLRHRRAPGQPERAHRPAAAHPLRLGDGLVVEPARELHAIPGVAEGVEELGGAGLLAQRRDLLWVVQRLAERRRQLGLHQPAVRGGGVGPLGPAQLGRQPGHALGLRAARRDRRPGRLADEHR